VKKLIVIDVVGLTRKIFEKSKPSNISKIIENGTLSSLIPCFPAVTCSVQASMLTGFYPTDHGIISNGYFDRNTMQVSFWEQFASMVEKPRVWDILKKMNPNMKTAVLFWQNSLFINSDIVITPKPIHLDDKMIMWCYSKPVNYYEEIAQKLGDFDLTSYWGPLSSIKSSKWILDAAKYTVERHSPDLLLVYLPHLDYAGQKYGPDSYEFQNRLMELDKMLGDFFEFIKNDNEYELILLSEYSFNSVNSSFSPNLLLRENGLLSVRNIKGAEYLDFENSKAFAMTDHQIAHVFIKSGYEHKVKSVFKNNECIEQILDKSTQKQFRIDHPKSGELILCATESCWFNYYWWHDAGNAPPFAYNVDIHRKPGFDPMELFFDQKTKHISTDTSLLKGSHGVFDPNKTENLPILALSTETKISNPIKIDGIVPLMKHLLGFNS